MTLFACCTDVLPGWPSPPTGIGRSVRVAVWLVATLVAFGSSELCAEASSAIDPHPLDTADTSNPRATLKSFIDTCDELYRRFFGEGRSFRNEAKLRDDFVARDTKLKVEMFSKMALLTPNLEEDSPRRLTLNSFHRLFPTFPMRLVAWKGKYIVEKCSLASLFRHPEQLDPFVVYDNLLETDPLVWEMHRVGLVIDWPTMEQCGGLVLHNQPIATEIPGMRMLWVSPQGSQLVIETLDTVLETMDKRCSGEDGWPPLYDPYHEYENVPRLIPDRRFIPVTKRDASAVEHLIDPEWNQKTM